MNFANTQAASKQAKSLLQESRQLLGQLGRERRVPLSIVSQGVLSLKDGGCQCGVQKDVVFSHGPRPVTHISPCPVGVLGVETSCKFYGFSVLLFPQTESPFFSFLFYQLRSGLEVKVPLGVGTRPVVNQACGDVTPWSPQATNVNQQPHQILHRSPMLLH